MEYRRRNDRPHVIVTDADPMERGKQRGKALGDELNGGLLAYMSFFEKAGLSQDTIRSAAMKVLETVALWRPRVVQEITGIAASVGVETWLVGALNARTEILALSRKGLPGECSTLAYEPGSATHGNAKGPFGIQTWDWNQELNDYWHPQSVSGGRYSFVGITEHGILGKIGLNSAGLAVFLNILAHEDDGNGGIPVHILAATVLEEAGSVEEGIELLRQAPLGSSTALTLMDRDRVMSVELSPAGAFLVSPQEGYLVHTNHFLNREANLREKPLYAPDTQNRFELISQRLATYGTPTKPDHLLEFLFSDPEQAHLCCLPQPGAELGRRWRTLTTILLDPANMRASILDGSPIEHRSRSWLELKPAQSN
ncbi:penicillin acyltransferase [Agrobacterium tumefaciens]|nr:penicillin acyltransferase [Agrobacterium tumefaciens]